MLDLDLIYRLLTKFYYYFQVSFLNGHALPPLHAFFEVTYRCNLRCSMCHSLSLVEGTDHADKKREELSSEQLIKILRKLPRKALVTFTGGEPFSRLDMISILSAACQSNKCHLITNGTMINEEIAKSLVELRAQSFLSSGLIMIGISLEGPEEIHDEIVQKKDSFQKTISAIKLIQDMKKKAHSDYPLIHLTTVITNKNAQHLSFIYSLAKDLNLDYCNFVLEYLAHFSRNYDSNSYDALYQVPKPPAKIEPSLLNSQLEILENLSMSANAPRLRFSPRGINRKEIVRHYSTGLNYKDYRCFVPWTSIGFSAFGDVFCCPHVRIGNTLENNYNTLWNSVSYKQFRKKLQREKTFPYCVGCCQSEHIGQ